MPAARPSQASLSNALAALADLGLEPAVLKVDPDGSFRIEIANPNGSADTLALNNPRDDSGPLSWGDAS